MTVHDLLLSRVSIWTEHSQIYGEVYTRGHEEMLKKAQDKKVENLPKPEKPYQYWSQPYSYRKLLKEDLSWKNNKTTHRGFINDTDGPQAARMTGEDKVIVFKSILLNIGSYGPKSIFIDVTKSPHGWVKFLNFGCFHLKTWVLG